MTTEGTFVWSDGTPLDYTDWEEYEPNDYGNNEDCGIIATFLGLKWNDFGCTRSLPYLCSYEECEADKTYTMTLTMDSYG